MNEDIYQEAILFHAKHKGKFTLESKVPVDHQGHLSLAYTPGVAAPCDAISKDAELSYSYTNRGNLVAVISDGTAVLGMGNIGAEAAMPVMEGKAILFKRFANVDAIPLCLRCTEVDELVTVIKNLEPSFGGINLEDIAAPRCFELEERLKQELSIPVFHDDQHGTAIVVLAGLLNALKITGKTMESIRVVINGAGAAGTATAKLLYEFGVGDVVLCDSKGVLYRGREHNMNAFKHSLAESTNKENMQGSLADALKGADVFVGVSVPNLVTQEMCRSMGENPIIFALSNPIPEIMPDQAHAAGAAVVCTGRSDFPNQVNNVLAFPGIFRGALDVQAKEISEAMKMEAARALANLISDEELSPDYVIPKLFDSRVMDVVASAVKSCYTSQMGS